MPLFVLYHLTPLNTDEYYRVLPTRHSSFSNFSRQQYIYFVRVPCCATGFSNYQR